MPTFACTTPVRTLGAAARRGVDLVQAHGAVAEIGDDQRRDDGQRRGPATPDPARRAAARHRSTAPLQRQHQRGDAEGPGEVGDLDHDRDERLRDRQVVREDLRHPDLDRDHHQRREHASGSLVRCCEAAGTAHEKSANASPW